MKGRVVLLIWYTLIMIVLMAIEGWTQVRVILKNGDRYMADTAIAWSAGTSFISLHKHDQWINVDKVFVSHIDMNAIRIRFHEDGKPCFMKTRGLRDESMNCDEKRMPQEFE